MERCGVELKYRGSRRSFEKPHGEAPPPLQVIGFNVSVPKEGGTSPSTVLPINKPAGSSSPRSSALQQLLLHQSPAPSTSSPSNHSLPPPLPPSTSPPSPNHVTFPPGLLSSHIKPAAASSSPSSSLYLPCVLLQPPAAANQSSTSTALLQPPAANPAQSTSSGRLLTPPVAHPNSTIAFSKPHSPPASAYQSISSSGLLKSLLQSVCAISDVPANQSPCTSLFSSVGQSQCASSSSSSSGNQTILRGSPGVISVDVHMINQHNSKPSKALIKENYEAFPQMKQGSDDKAKELINGNDAKAHEISAKEIIKELPYIGANSQKSSWFRDDNENPSPGQCKNINWKGVQQINELPFGSDKSRKSIWNEEKNKKSSVFMLAATSPAAEFHYHHHHHHHAEHNASGNMDFLSSCHLCRRLLGQGQDVFMYSGDKAFCSMECRYQQIVIDERKERCPPPIIRSGASHSSVTATTTHHPIIINERHFINTAAAA